MAGLLSAEIMDDAALLLNDAAKLTFTYAVQTPWLKKAVKELSDELAVNNIPLLEKITVVTPIIVGSTTTIQLPVDCLVPNSLEERAAGSSDKWIRMDEVGNIDPNYTPANEFNIWAFQGTLLNSTPVIDVPNATSLREVRVNYTRFLSTVGLDSSTDFTSQLTWQCERFVSAKIAELITRFILQNTKRGTELSAECQKSIYRLIQIWTKKRQNRPVRKSGYNNLPLQDIAQYPAGSSGGSSPAPSVLPGYDYYVRNYGAVGDGFTDDTVAINNTIAAARVTGGRVIFDPKTYLVSSTISVVGLGIGFRPIFLVGYGKIQNLQVNGTAGTIIKWIGTTANGTVINFFGLNSCGIFGISVDCGITAGSVIVADYGFNLEASVSCSFIDLNVFRANKFGFRLRASTAGFYSNYFRDITTDFSCIGGMIQDTTNIFADIAHCNFTRMDLNFSGAGGFGLDLAASDTNLFNGLTLIAFNNAAGHLIRMRDVSVSDYGCRFNTFIEIDGGVSSGGPGPTIQADSTFTNVMFGFSNANGFLETFVGAHPENVFLIGEASGINQQKLSQFIKGVPFGASSVLSQQYFDSSANKFRFQNHGAAGRLGWIFSGNFAANPEVVAFEVNGDGQLFERGRAVSLGEYNSRVYAAGDYTASAGTWTTVAGTTKFKISIVGKDVTIIFNITGSSVSNAGVTLRIALPAGFVNTADFDVHFPVRVRDAGAAVVWGVGVVAAGDNKIQLFATVPGTGFNIAAANTDAQGQFQMEIQ